MKLLIIVLLTLFAVFVNGISTIPFSVGLLVISTVIFKKSWVFFLAFGLGLFLDLTAIRLLGYSSLILTILVFILFLYERKFETGTTVFVFISTFLGSLIYLMIFGYQEIFLQALVNSMLTILFFKLSARPKLEN
jgi:hypothetical protein